MPNKDRCQSCGMPLGEYRDNLGRTLNNFGTDRDESRNTEYCSYCFRYGKFLLPNLTMQQMIDLSIENMTKDLGLDKEKAQELAYTVIPNLKRWRP